MNFVSERKEYNERKGENDGHDTLQKVLAAFSHNHRRNKYISGKLGMEPVALAFKK